MNKFYITTAIAYVNGQPHLGHALEFVQADALYRFHKLAGDESYFLTGTDEHGSKIYEKAQELDIPVQEFVDKNAGVFRSLKDLLHLDYDDFIRTSEERHKKGAQKIWQKMVDNGDIYKDSYVGKYCVGCESFISDKELTEDGKCPVHLKEPEMLSEENYFFKLSKYSDRIKEAIVSGEVQVVPENRKKEMLNIIGDDGLFDVSFSRPKDVLPWGVNVPGDDSQVMYVWCDALSNYITALGYEEGSELFKKFWPADVQVIGKDILRFHAGIWLGMLLSADLPLPKVIFAHGFITSEGQKMSKSLGNVVDPLDYVEEFGVEPLRYYLLREVPTNDDGDFARGRFFDVFNSDLANNVGNLVNRVLMMTEKYFEGRVPEKGDGNEVRDVIEGAVLAYNEKFEKFDIKGACEEMMNVANFANKYIDDKKPWVMAKEEQYGLAEVMYDLLELVRVIAVLMQPILPHASSRIAEKLDLDVDQLLLNDEFGVLQEGHVVSAGDPLFPRLEDTV